MSSLLRSSAMRRALSAALSGGAQGASLRLVPAARRCLGLPTSPRRHLSGNNAPADSSSSAQVDRINEVQRQIHEVEQLCEQIVAEHVKLHRSMKAADHDHFERLLTKYGMPKSKFRDVFMWRCKLATIFVASVTVGYLLHDI